MGVAQQLFWEGTPVPYVAMWSSEMAGYRLAADQHAGGKLSLFTVGERGTGEPVWGLMNEQRQRQTVATRRCQVCNTPLRGLGYGMDTLEMMYGDSPVLREPPACATCTRYALSHCPGNRRRHAAGTLHCYKIQQYEAIGTILGRVGEGQQGTPALEAVLAPGQTCIGMLKCVLTRYRTLTWDELLQEVSR